ncbi:hypothetical protein, partial [Streptococcus pneumoniae]
EHQKRKDEICPFSSLAFLQPTTVDKEPKNSPSDKIRGARNVVKSTAELLNFMVRDKIVH